MPEKSIIDSSVDYSKDLFFLNENSEIVTLLQYNPDSNSGGQFVSTNVRYSQIQEAAQKFENSAEDFLIILFLLVNNIYQILEQICMKLI